MDNKRNTNFDETRVHGSINKINANEIKNQQTILGGNNRIKNEMRKKGLQHTTVPKTKRSSRDRSLDFDPFLEETIYDERNKKQKSNSSVKFVIITLLIAVMVCISVFAVAFKMVLDPEVASNNDNLNTTDGNINNNTGENVTDVIASENVEEITAVVKDFNIDDKTLGVMDIENKKTYTFVVDGKTKLYDQYGKTIVFAELGVADVLDITFDSASVYITRLSKNKNSFTEKRVTGLEVDTLNKTITNGNKTYMYTDDIVVMDKDEIIDITNINKMDTVTFGGYNDLIYKIDVLKGHGTISFTNIEAVENGVVEIDTDILFRLSVETSSEVSIGQHNLVIKGDNIDTYTNKIFVDQNEEVVIDLSNLPNKKGLLDVKTNVSEPSIEIDGVVYTEPILLPYGTYVMTVSAEDYEHNSKSITISEEKQEVEINLKEIKKNARMVLDTIPTGAEVYMDDRLIGLSPIDQKVEVGNHSFIIKLDGYDDKVFNFTAEEKTYSYTLIMDEEKDGDDLIIP